MNTDIVSASRSANNSEELLQFKVNTLIWFDRILSKKLKT